MDGAGIDELIAVWAGDGMPAIARVAGSLLRRMREGKIRNGGMLPSNGALARKGEASAIVAGYAKQMLLCLGLAERKRDGFVSRVEPRRGGHRPNEAKTARWRQSPDITERIMAALTGQILTGQLPRYAELPAPETLREQWGCQDTRSPAEALRRLAAYPGLVTVDGGRYLVT